MRIDEAKEKMTPEQVQNFAVLLALYQLARDILSYSQPNANLSVLAGNLSVAGALAENFMIVRRNNRLDNDTVARGFDWIIRNGIARPLTRNGAAITATEAIAAVVNAYSRVKDWRRGGAR